MIPAFLLFDFSYLNEYNSSMNSCYEIASTKVFDNWLDRLPDQMARAQIFHRIERAEAGNLGDCRPVGDGVSEMRIHYGPGYRLYFGQLGKVLYLLISGGDKKTQAADIAKARTEWLRIKEEGYDEGED